MITRAQGAALEGPIGTEGTVRDAQDCAPFPESARLRRRLSWLHSTLTNGPQDPTRSRLTWGSCRASAARARGSTVAGSLRPVTAERAGCSSKRLGRFCDPNVTMPNPCDGGPTEWCHDEAPKRESWRLPASSRESCTQSGATGQPMRSVRGGRWRRAPYPKGTMRPAQPGLNTGER